MLPIPFTLQIYHDVIMPLAVLDGEAPAPSPWGSLPLEKYVLSQWDSPAPMSETHSESRTHLIRQFLHLESQGRDASLSSALALFILMLSLTHIQISGRTDLQHHILMRTRRKPPRIRLNRHNPPLSPSRASPLLCRLHTLLGRT